MHAIRKLCFCIIFCLSSLAASSRPVAVRNVAVIDVARGAVLRGRTVLVRGDQIERVGLVSEIVVPGNAVVIDGSGKFAIPGLWDMHVHLWYKENQFPLYLAWGITGVRDMGSDYERVKRWRSEVEAGTLLGPHVETSGIPLDGVASGDEKLPVSVIRTPKEARAACDRLDAAGVDFIKVLSELPRDAYFALLERARQWRIPVSGHVPDTVSIDEAVDARQKSMEHMFGLLLSCSSQEGKLRKARLAAVKSGDQAAYRQTEIDILNTYSEQKAGELFVRMARFDAWQVPTLTMYRRMFAMDADELVANPMRRRISYSIAKGWQDPREERKKFSPETVAYLNRKYDMLAFTVKWMQSAGVPILAGTDTGDPYAYPGYELHRELELLVKAGLTPMEALRSATISPARYLDATDSLGTIQAGKMADLVLLQANPLDDIRNTRRIAGVMVRGRYLPRMALDLGVAGMKRNAPE